VPVYYGCHAIERRKRCWIVKVEMGKCHNAPFAVHCGGTDIHSRRASNGLALVERNGLLDGIVS